MTIGHDLKLRLTLQIISFGVDSVADNKENMTKIEEHSTPSKKGGLGERRRQFGSSKSVNSITK